MMRALVGLYVSVGIVLLLVGFLATGPCPDKNRDVVSNVVFVLGWPVYLYDDVVHGDGDCAAMAAPAGLRRRCRRVPRRRHTLIRPRVRLRAGVAIGRLLRPSAPLHCEHPGSALRAARGQAPRGNLPPAMHHRR